MTGRASSGVTWDRGQAFRQGLPPFPKNALRAQEALSLGLCLGAVQLDDLGARQRLTDSAHSSACISSARRSLGACAAVQRPPWVRRRARPRSGRMPPASELSAVRGQVPRLGGLCVCSGFFRKIPRSGAPGQLPRQRFGVRYRRPAACIDRREIWKKGVLFGGLCPQKSLFMVFSRRNSRFWGKITGFWGTLGA